MVPKWIWRLYQNVLHNKWIQCCFNNIRHPAYFRVGIEMEHELQKGFEDISELCSASKLKDRHDDLCYRFQTSKLKNGQTLSETEIIQIWKVCLLSLLLLFNMG